IKEEIEKLGLQMEEARRKGDWQKMSEIQYGRIPPLEAQLKQVEKKPDLKKPRLLRTQVGAEEIAEVVSRMTGIPVAKMMQGEREKLIRMEDKLHERVVGQDEAVRLVSEAIRRSRSGLADPNRHYGSFLFLRTTGVCKNTVIVMTSNLGSQMIQSMAGSDYAVVKAAVMAEVKTHFRPEFVNRIDEVVVFHALGEDSIKSIARIQLGVLQKRLSKMDYGLDVSDAVLGELAKVGFDPVYEARPLKRAIQSEIENPLAKAILEGRFSPKDSIRVDYRGGRMLFEKAPARVAA